MGEPEATNGLEELIELLTSDVVTPLSDIAPLILRRNGKRPVVVSVLPVPEAERNRFLGARALLTLVPIGAKHRPELGLLARVFNFTPAEARLAAALAGGGSIDEAAGEIGITRDTARNQLKAVFAKTRTHRQSQLVALLAQL